MPPSSMMPSQICGRMSKRQLFMHWNAIAWKKQHKGMKRSLNHLWSILFQKSYWRFWAFLIGVWDTSLEMHYHELRKMKNFVTLSSNAIYPMWGRQNGHGMLSYGSGNLASPFDLKKCKQSLISMHQKPYMDGIYLQTLPLF
jgi:hypothetical protein